MSTLASRIDHTILKAEATRPEVHVIVAEALEHGFASSVDGLVLNYTRFF